MRDGGQGGQDRQAGRPAEPGRPVELLRDLDRPGAWLLLAGGVPQSHIDLRDPRHLELPYVHWLGHLIDLAAPPGAPLRALHLGGGGLTLARYLAATRPGSRQLAVEASAEVAGLVRRRLPLARPGQPGSGPGGITVRIADARAAVADLETGSFDVVVADVFAGGQTPAHLTSVEFTAAVARVLAPGGWYAVNVGDGPPLGHTRGRAAATASVFRYACLIAEADVLAGHGFGNLVIAAADRPLPIARLARLAGAGPDPAQVVSGAALGRLIAGWPPIIDADAQPSPPPPPETFA